MSKAEKFICENTKALKELNGKKYFKWLTPNDARKAVEIARDELMENVCQFIQKHHHEYTSWNTEEYELEFNTEQFIQDIKQVMNYE